MCDLAAVQIIRELADGFDGGIACRGGCFGLQIASVVFEFGIDFAELRVSGVEAACRSHIPAVAYHPIGLVFAEHKARVQDPGHS